MPFSKKYINNRIYRVVFLFSASIFFYSAVKELVYRWFTAGSYYNQGPFVAVIFFWIIIRRFRSLVGNSDNSHIHGLLFISAAVLSDLFGRYISILTFQFFGIYLFILGCSFLFAGKKFVYRNLPLYIYLILAIPIPSFLLDYLTFNLKVAAAGISGFILSAIYPSTVLFGNTLVINDYFIEITPACSGMENIFAMASLLWFFALFQRRKVIAVLDYAIAIPAALVSNILRILIVSILTINGYGKFALEDFHEEIGVAVFIIIFILIILFNEFPRLKSEWHDKITDNPNSDGADKNNYLLPLIIIISVLAAGSLAVKSGDGKDKNEKYPLVINNIKTETPGWDSRDEKLEDYYFSMLQTKDILMREYFKKNDYSGDGSVYLYFIHAKGDRTPFLHRPELCLTGEGYSLIQKEVITLQVTGTTVSRMLFERSGKGLLVYCWYRFNGMELNSYLNLQFKMVTQLEKGLDCSMIRLSIIVDPGNVDKGEVLLREFAEKEIPSILENI